MDEYIEVPRVTMPVIHGCLVASIQINIDDDVLHQFQRDLLRRIRVTGAKGAIIDVSGVEIMDSSDFMAIRRTISMAALMGVDALLVGLQPGIVASLVDMDLDFDDLKTALNLEEAFRMLGADTASPEEEKEVTESIAEDSDEAGRGSHPNSERDRRHWGHHPDAKIRE